MESYLAIDVGAGTQDILLFEKGIPVENCIKLVLPSRSFQLAGQVEKLTTEGKDIFLDGTVMGSGFFSSMIKKHIRAGYRVFATPAAAKTFRDNLDEVRARGIEIVETPPGEATLISLKDVILEPLLKLFSFYDRLPPSKYYIAVQDHGECLQGSNRQVRFNYWMTFLRGSGYLRELLFDEVPPLFTRMAAIKEALPDACLMDTGPAALLGSLHDSVVMARAQEGVVLVNVGNQHTLAALVKGERVLGLMEHHTCFMSAEKIADLVNRFRTAILTHQEVFDEKGHGAALLDEYRDEKPFSFVSVTGPRRQLARGLGYHFAAPHGDMMLTGCFGLLAAAGLLQEAE